ncbi:glycoside hydrolase family 45 protein [Laetiporus sulphureus 93-53]|uniref:Glycoside hydrolase family 45 protein n=1 Tax=Laetiporus sulphureus 93-53 TaxID=1314785 RepID=A0A165HWZ8_9APHY|nr:glycoside hydrolase family 45 protein [Laetiporus sulphureus 93-53]KZT12299.1 glycoside hydrolase family 45 protein [Laetiporus sulphureus 93-53]
MKSTYSLAVLVLASIVPNVASAKHAPLRRTEPANSNGYYQQPSDNSSFTEYSGCSTPACGETATGYTAAMNQLSFGAPSGDGEGDACGRCFRLTGTVDPYSPDYSGPFYSIVVKVTDLCPVEGNAVWCGQTTEDGTNEFDMPVHFDICEDTGGAGAFFPSVDCSEWSGSDGSSLWTGSCLSGESAAFWPDGTGCGNQGTAPSFGACISCAVYRHDLCSILRRWFFKAL